jgi:hypothetical protein
MPLASTSSWPRLELAVIAIGFAPALDAVEGGAVLADVGDDDAALPPDEPQPASANAARAATETTTAPRNRIERGARGVVDIMVLIAISSTS